MQIEERFQNFKKASKRARAARLSKNEGFLGGEK
jgi:hypothetical protein